MKVKPRSRQSLIDMALQTSGGTEAVLALAINHDIPVDAYLDPDMELETVDATNKLVLERYKAQGVCPATDPTQADIEALPYGGINYMGVEIDFIVS